ncbi:MAG: tetratricopeptide repeat protein [Gammaproteobacteria bacterium WSBS_2016_MAG_OTU1]
MSLLLNSLKKADQENQNAEAEKQEGVEVVSPESSQVVAANPAASSSIDFDNIDSSSADVEATLSREGAGQQKDLVSASRVFRAGGDAEEHHSSGKVYVLIITLILIGGSVGVLTSGIVPGVNVPALLGLFGDKKAVVASDIVDDVPILTTASDGSKLIALPVPLVDIQADVEFAGLQVPNSSDLSTLEGRREYAKRIAILTGTSNNEDTEAEDDEFLGLDFGDPLEDEAVLAEEAAGVEEEAIEEEYTGIKTAEDNRLQRFSIGLRTPSDGAISRGVKINKVEQEEEIVVAQASTEEFESSEGEDAADSEGAAAVEETRETAEDIVVPSLSGIERQKMLSEARRFYIDGSYANAESVYRNILARSPLSRDALRGLALVAVATGRYQAAAATYLKILEYYPNDPVAIADLTNLHDNSTGENFYEIESALKKLIGDNPQLDPRLYFTLGNLYSRNNEWSEAQQSYFKAHSGEPTNPDYAYNLAVVLDYLNKPNLAVNYYREALELAKNRPSGFNSGEVEVRINSILK